MSHPYFSGTGENEKTSHVAVTTTVELLDGREIDIRWSVYLCDGGPSYGPERYNGSEADCRQVTLVEGGADVPVADVERLSGKTWEWMQEGAIEKAAEQAWEDR